MLEAKSVIGGQGVRADAHIDEAFPDSSNAPSAPPDDRRRDGRQPFKIQTCRFFLQGTCNKGEKCTYLHGGETPRERGPPPRERRPSESEWSAGDWECRKCGQHNFSKRATCFRCEAEKGSPDRRGPPPSRAIRQAEDELREAEILLKTAQGEGNAKSISLAEEAIGRAMLAVKRARELDDEERRDRRAPPRDYRRRSRSPPRYGFRDRSPRDFRDRSPPRGYRDRWGSDRGGWGPDQGPSWGGPPGPYPPHGPPASYPPTSRPIDPSYDSAPQGRWEETVAPNGDKYYWHTVTKETSWTDPRVTAPPAPTPVPVALNWEVAIDEHGDKYYWHTVTGATQWEPPPGFVDKSKAPVPAATAARPQQYPPRLNAPTTSSLKGSQASRGVQRLG